MGETRRHVPMIFILSSTNSWHNSIDRNILQDWLLWIIWYAC